MTVSADSELEKLHSELAHVDDLASLQTELAAVDAELKRLDNPGLGPASAVLFYRRYYQREREKIMLRIGLLDLPRKIETCKRNYEIESSPGAHLRHKKHCQMIQQGRALGRSRETSLPSDPQVAAGNSLTEILAKLKRAELRLQELTTGNAEWAELLRTTAQPVLPATQAPAPASVRSGNAGRTPADPETNIGQAATLAKSTAHRQLTSTGEVSDQNRARVEAFIVKMAAGGSKITRTNIWTVAGYTNRTEFERFQSGKRCTLTAQANFNRVLSMNPEDFVSVLRKKLSSK